jgi:hypothetical protein
MLPEHVDDGKPGVAEIAKDETPVVADAQTEEASVEPTKPDESEAAPPTNSLYVDPLEMTQPSEATAPQAETAPVETPQESMPQPTPFLADAQVDKRPLGAFGEAESTEAPASEAPAAVDTQAAPTVPLPRELQPDVVEVESSAQETEVQPVAAPATESKPTAADDGRVEGHPLFDTSTYHEPITAVQGKGMPAWAKWLIGLLVCLALGAGVGYFLFTAGL